jgi:hypothetical protein
VIFLLAAFAASAQAAFFLPSSPFSNNAVGTTGAAFLQMPTGSRVPAMGGVAAASVEGSDAIFWNPAGLARLAPEDPSEIALNYNSLLQATYEGSAAYAVPLSNGGVLGFGLIYFSQASQTAYDAVGTSVGNFTPDDMACDIAYAQRWKSTLIGGGLKIIRSQIATAQGATAAIDLGIQSLHVTDVGNRPVDIGASITNLGPPIQVGNVASALPTEIRGGFIWRLSNILKAGLDIVADSNQAPYASFGFESVFKSHDVSGALRLGYNQSYARGISGLGGFAGGGGFDIGKFRVDYAWVPFGILGVTNRISLTFRF